MIDFTLTGKPYSSQNELLDNFSEVLDLHIYYMYKYHTWVSPDNNLQSMLGVVVSREEFESNLMKAVDSMAYHSLTGEETEELSRVRDYFLDRYNATVLAENMFPLIMLGVNFGLDLFEYSVILTLICCELNKKYEKLFAFLQDDISKKTISVETAIHLWAEPGDMVSDYFFYFSGDSVLTKFFCSLDEGTLGGRMLHLSGAVSAFFSGNPAHAGYDFFRKGTEISPMCINNDAESYAVNAVKNSIEGKTTLIFVYGQPDSGRKFLIKHCAAENGEGVLFVTASSLLASADVSDAFNQAVCAARLEGFPVCLTDFELFLDEDNPGKLAAMTSAIKESAEQLGTHFYITSKEKWQLNHLGEKIVKLDLELPETNEEQRLALWEHYLQGLQLEDGLSSQELAAKFRFTAGQTAAAVERAKALSEVSSSGIISAELLHSSCYDQVVEGLNTLATPIKPAYDWDDLVLPQSEINQLRDACTHIRYRHTVYSEWGFGKKAAYGRGLSLLFSGPPGTGKTMAAQVITNQLHMKLYKIQLSQIVSKYIGETEKNLRKVFTEAKNANCVLFFDETDALFGKRSEVKDSHDRHANIETAYLLQQMEEYDGVVLMATNLLQNIDEAFMRRISFVISFPFPDADTRKLLWKKMFDAKAPLSDDIDFDFLAQAFRIAGGNIKNCVVHSAFLAAAEGVPIGMRHILRSVVKEQRKNNVIVLKEELRQYADMVFGTD